MADISWLVQESLSVSGILLGKTMGRTGELAGRFAPSPSAPPTSRSGPDGGPLDDGLDPDLVRGDAGARLPGCRPFRVRLDRDAGCLYHPADADSTRRSAACSRISIDVQSSLALFDRVFKYLNLPIDVGGTRTGVRTTVRGNIAASRTLWFRYEHRRMGATGGRLPRSRPGRRPRSWARPAPGRRRWATSSPGCATLFARAGSPSTVSTCAS